MSDKRLVVCLVKNLKPTWIKDVLAQRREREFYF